VQNKQMAIELRLCLLLRVGNPRPDKGNPGGFMHHEIPASLRYS
jgi:hypothetical protein